MRDPLPVSAYRDLVGRALAEDLGAGDVTTDAIAPAGVQARGQFLVKRDCVVAGLDVVAEVFAQVGFRPGSDKGQTPGDLRFTAIKRDGDACHAGDAIAEVSGAVASMLAAERTALNFLQHLSGIATLTRRFVDAAHGRLTILDTRKTIPTLRPLQKYAVRCGGGTNHRLGLWDAVLIKDNHIRLAGSIAEAVRRVRASQLKLTIEVEAQSLGQVDQAVAAGADVIMLDNLPDDLMREAIRRIGGRARVEISGGITLDRIPVLADIGADCVSVGALTHSAPAADISLEIQM